jgi:hypothetical protein
MLSADWTVMVSVTVHDGRLDGCETDGDQTDGELSTNAELETLTDLPETVTYGLLETGAGV